MLRVESQTKLEGFTEFEEHILFDEDDPDFDPSMQLVLRRRSDKQMMCRESTIIQTSNVSLNMSLASVHHPATNLHSNQSSLTTMSHSLEDITTTPSTTTTSWNSPTAFHQNLFPHFYQYQQKTIVDDDDDDDDNDNNNVHHLHRQQRNYKQQMDHVLTIEELRLHMTSCFTCGVSWNDSHVSLDCSECGGYALERPCPMCDGKCDTIWKRDLSLSHASSKARWQGECQLKTSTSSSLLTTSAPSSSSTTTTTTAKDSSTNNNINEELTSRLKKLSANS